MFNQVLNISSDEDSTAGQPVPVFREFSIDLQKISAACVGASEKVQDLFSKIDGSGSPFSIAVFRKILIVIL